ncbi:MAG: hypothetical protein AABX35_00600 [Nanoarchaeota archaeon]
MKKNNKRVTYITLAIIITISLILSGIYLYKNKQVKEVYFERYAECDAKAKENPIRSAGGVKNTEELKFVVSCFENKGCYDSCGNSRDPVHPGINFMEIFNIGDSNLAVCVQRCYYSPEYFK